MLAGLDPDACINSMLFWLALPSFLDSMVSSRLLCLNKVMLSVTSDLTIVMMTYLVSELLLVPVTLTSSLLISLDTGVAPWY